MAITTKTGRTMNVAAPKVTAPKVTTPTKTVAAVKINPETLRPVGTVIDSSWRTVKINPETMTPVWQAINAQWVAYWKIPLSSYVSNSSSTPKNVYIPTNTSKEVATVNTVLPAYEWMPDVYWNYNNLLSSLWDNTGVSNWLKTLLNSYDNTSNTWKFLSNLYSTFNNSLSPEYDKFSYLNSNMDKDVVSKLQEQLSTAYRQYWEQWEQTKRIWNFYIDAAKNLADQNAANMWAVDAEAKASWASAWAVRAAKNAQAQQSNAQFIALKQQELADYDGIYKSLNSYIDNFISKYKDTRDVYVRDTANQLLNYKTQLWQAYLNTASELRQAEAALAAQNIANSWNITKSWGVTGGKSTTDTNELWNYWANAMNKSFPNMFIPTITTRN